MKILFFFVLFLLFSSPVSGQAIPGVPVGCCGLQDCSRASVLFQGFEGGQAVVRVNGKTLRVARQRYSQNTITSSSWYCRAVWIPECKAGEISERCAVCLIEASGRVRSPINPLAAVPVRAGISFIAERDCGRCHK